MVKVNNFGKMVQFSKGSSFKDLKFLVNFPGQMEHRILANLNKIDLKVKESLLMKMEDTIMVNGKTT